MPSPLGRVPPKGVGEVCPQGTVAPTGQHLFRHGLRRATFPRGEGFAALNNNFSYLFSMATATSRATFIMVVKAVWRSAAVVSTPLRMWSEMVQMHRPRLP